MLDTVSRHLRGIPRHVYLSLQALEMKPVARPEPPLRRCIADFRGVYSPLSSRSRAPSLHIRLRLFIPSLVAQQPPVSVQLDHPLSGVQGAELSPLHVRLAEVSVPEAPFLRASNADDVDHARLGVLGAKTRPLVAFHAIRASSLTALLVHHVDHAFLGVPGTELRLHRTLHAEDWTGRTALGDAGGAPVHSHHPGLSVINAHAYRRVLHSEGRSLITARGRALPIVLPQENHFCRVVVAAHYPVPASLRTERGPFVAVRVLGTSCA